MPPIRQVITKRSSAPAKDAPSRIGVQGGDIIKRARAEAIRQKEESDRRKNGANAFRFFVEKGKEAELIILDSRIEEGWAMWEHNLKQDGKWGRHVPCVKSFATCPICTNKAADSRSTYITFLTVLDLTGYTTREGKHVPYSKRLLPISASQLEQFIRIQDAAIEESGTLRGTYLIMSRDNGDKSPRIGAPIPHKIKGAPLFQTYDEDTLVAEFGSAAVKDKKTGAIIRALNEDITPYKYKNMFVEPDLEALDVEFGEGDGGYADHSTTSHDDEPGDDIPMKHPTDKKTAPAKKVAKKSAKAEPADVDPLTSEELLELAAIADNDSGEEEDENIASAEETLTTEAEARDLDPDDYVTWLELVEAFEESAEAETVAEHEAEELDVSELTADEIRDLGPAADDTEDEGQVQAEIALTDLAAASDIDPNEYATWVELAEHLADVKEEEEKPAPPARKAVAKKAVSAPAPSRRTPPAAAGKGKPDPFRRR